jgi:hypothetical protein
MSRRLIIDEFSAPAAVRIAVLFTILVTEMTTRLNRGLALVFLALAPVASSGCSRGSVGTPSKDTENLTSIRKAYMAATNRLGRPPKNLDELKPSLSAEGNADELLISPNDGLPYIIVFGADPRKYVMAYEQKGVDGVRMVIDHTPLPKRIENERFDILTFPPGYKKPGINK